jgi:hypothetical protein
MRSFVSGVALVLATTLASAANSPPPAGSDASLPFAAHNIWTWQADGQKGIWVRSTGGQWYYGAFTSPCQDLQFHDDVGFQFGPAGELDKFGEVHVRHNIPCYFKSFSLSAGPPGEKGKDKANPQPTSTAPPSRAG